MKTLLKLVGSEKPNSLSTSFPCLAREIKAFEAQEPLWIDCADVPALILLYPM